MMTEEQLAQHIRKTGLVYMREACMIAECLYPLIKGEVFAAVADAVTETERYRYHWNVNDVPSRGGDCNYA